MLWSIYIDKPCETMCVNICAHDRNDVTCNLSVNALSLSVSVSVFYSVPQIQSLHQIQSVTEANQLHSPFRML